MKQASLFVNPSLVTCLCLIITSSEALTPLRHRSTINEQHMRLTLHSSNNENNNHGGDTNAAVRSPLFYEEPTTTFDSFVSRTPTTTTTTTKRTILQRFQSQHSALAIATAVTLASSSWLMAPAPVSAAAAAAAPPKTPTPIETAVEKYSVSFWTPETDSLPKPQQQNQKRHGFRLPQNHQKQQQPSRKAMARRRQAARTMQQKRALAAKKYKALQQHQPSRGGSYDYNQYSYYEDGSMTAGQTGTATTGIMGIALACALLTLKITYVATIVVAAIAVGNEDFAASLRQRMAFYLDDLRDFRLSGRVEQNIQDKVARSKALVVLVATRVAQTSNNTTGKVRHQVTSAWSTGVNGYQTAVKNLHQKLDDKYLEQQDATTTSRSGTNNGNNHYDDDGYETAQDLDALMTSSDQTESSTTTTPQQQRVIDERLKKFYKRVRSEERGKMMTNVMLRKSKDEEYYEEVTQAERYRREHRREVMDYGLMRRSSTKEGGGAKHAYANANNAKLQKIIHPAPSSSSSALQKSSTTTPVALSSSSSSSLATATAGGAKETTSARPITEKALKPRDQFDIRYLMWKFLSRKREEALRRSS